MPKLTPSTVICGALSLSFLFLTVKGEIIESPTETNWGEWGVWARCPFGRYAQAIQLKTEPYQGAVADDSAANAIRLFCGDPNNSSTIYITSKEGEWGNWGRVYSCRSDGRPLPPDGYITGFQLRVESAQLGDDTATNNIRVFCNYPQLPVAEQMVEADGLTYGSWTSYRKCGDGTRQAVCAVQTQVESYQGSGDDTAWNNVRMECCTRNLHLN